ncbi:MAG: hypothetical protein K6G18_04405 [Treponema sp.]|nr:hypothetical protein [Treponema sp.]
MNQTQGFEHYLTPRFSGFHYVPDIDNIVELGKTSITEYYGKLVVNEARNSLIADDVKDVVRNGRTPLILYWAIPFPRLYGGR